MATEELVAPSATGFDASMDAPRPDPRRKSRAPNATPPKGFESDAEFLQYVRRLYDEDLSYDRENREEAVLDLKFVSGDQWDASVKQKRISAGKPVITVNRLPAFVAQLVGNRRMTDTGIRIVPDSGGDKKVASIREGLIRSIQKNSRAQYVYDSAFSQTVMAGIGNFQILLDYAHDDVFEQDIKLRDIPNVLSVVWDSASVEPTGADADHVFIVDPISHEEFKRRFPDASAGSFDNLLESGAISNHARRGEVQLMTFWRMQSEKRFIGMMTDGTVQDVTDLPAEAFVDLLMTNTETGEPMLREVQRKYAEMWRVSPTHILEGPYRLPIQRVPVFRVPGWEVFIEGERKRWGMVRFARDPQKMHNFWRATIAEKLVGSPKAKWLATDSAVQGREESFRKSHLSDDPLLVYNEDAGVPPQRIPAAEVETGLLEQAATTSQDIRDVVNIHEAGLGMTSNEVSGKAIQARVRVGEVGSMIYQDNLNMAIEEAGKVINQLIPVVYDTTRTIKTLGTDLVTEEQVRINDPRDPSSVDITIGKYSVTVTTGPSYTTRRVESREEMMGMVNAMPDLMARAADLIIENQDWPGADKLAARLRRTAPPGMIPPSDLSSEEQEALQSQQQAAQQQEQVQQAMIAAELQEKQAKAQLQMAQAQKAMSEAAEATARAELAKAQAAEAIAAIQSGRVADALAIVEMLNPTPALSGANVQ